MRSTRLRGARTNNLRALDLDFEPGTLVAIAGPSGAGKSSLAFGTLYAEGQRRYVESFSAYARQFLERLGRPPVDELEPVPAGIAVERQAPVKTSRSTVGTMTELTDYAKGVWARAAELHCPSCARLVTRDSAQSAAATVMAQAKDARLLVTYPVRVANADQFMAVRESLLADGYRRVRVGGEIKDLDQVRPSDVVGAGAAKKGAATKGAAKKAASHSTSKPTAKKGEGDVGPVSILEVIADRTVARDADKARLVEAIEMAMQRGAGRVDVVVEGKDTLRFSRALHCAHCDLSFRDATPGIFSFNSPIGACEICRGFGRTIGVDWERVLPDRRKTLAGGAIRPWTGKSTTWERKELVKHAKLASVPLDVPVEQLTEKQYEWLIEGDEKGWPKGWGGLRGWFAWLETRAYKMHVRVLLSRYRSYEKCEACQGTRLKQGAQNWKIEGKSITDFYATSVSAGLEFLERQAPKWQNDPATALVLRECTSRLRTLCEVGLEYLTLDRASRTLSGGEAQRVALTSALGSSLTGAMFVLDEPTVGLHASDVEKLFRVVRRLTEGENLALVVEHDPAFIAGADRVIELGPGAGELGGQVVFDGTPAALARAATATARALSHALPYKGERRKAKQFIRLFGATGHNLKNVDIQIPVGALTCVTGVSGSGKSSLILETLVPALSKALAGLGQETLPYAKLEGADLITDVVHVDQSPLGRTSRGNPATYLQIWDVLRKRFASQPLAKERGYGPGFFSFNVPGGRCEACKGEGAETIEMQFLADVTFSCPECGGKRFVGAALDVQVEGRNVADVLAMTAHEALTHFAGDKELEKRLAPLVSVGLSYLRLGQPLSTLSGGEAQRLKLAESLAEAKKGSLIVLDEPTAGLHHDDVSPLLEVLQALVDRGDTVIVVEHDLRVCRSIRLRHRPWPPRRRARRSHRCRGHSRRSRARQGIAHGSLSSASAR
jgi:excinuclease ABC subunit A